MNIRKIPININGKTVKIKVTIPITQATRRVKLSRVPEDANKYAIKQLYKIRNENIEVLKGMDYSDGKICAETSFIRGTADSVSMSTGLPNSITIHNHPNAGYFLSLQDIESAIKSREKKAFACNSTGFSAIDFTTIKKHLWRHDLLRKISELKFKFQNDKLDDLKEFAKYSGATVSDVKWSDFRKKV